MEYDNEADAHKALEEMQHKRISGLVINIEWSKRSGKFDQKPRSGRDGYAYQWSERFRKKEVALA